MIKVLHYLSNLGLGGTEKTCQLFLDNLNPDEFEITLAYKHGGPREELFRRIPHLQLLRVVDYSSLDLQSHIKRFQPDILHVYRSGFREFPEPNEDVHVPHFIETNVFGQVDPNPAIDKSLFMSEWLLNNTLRRTAPIARGLANRSRWDFVNNPVEEPYTSDVLSVAKLWKNEGAIILGRCGRPDPGIYHALNVKAAQLLRVQGYNIRFIVVAPPPNMLDDLTEWDIPFYVIEPTVDPVVLSTFYNSIDIYAHARADGETFGVNIAEAMMHGKPVVTHIAEPSFPGMGVFQSQTTLVNHGITGFVSPNDSGTYTNALRLLVDNEDMRLAMGEAGRDKATREYLASSCTRKLERIYKEIMA